MSGVLFYNPLAVAALAEQAQAAAAELAATSAAEDVCSDAVTVAHGIAGDIEQTLGSALVAVLTDQSMVHWHPVFSGYPGSIDHLVAELTAEAPDPDGRFFLDEGEFSLATAVRTGSPDGTWHDAAYGVACVAFPGGTYAGGGFVTDHKGVSYPIVVPQVETDDGHVYTADLGPVAVGEASVATLGGTDPGWAVVGVATGVERFQATPSTPEQIAAFFAGTTGLVVPRPPNSGLVYIEPGVNGGPPHLTAQPGTPAPVAPLPAAGAPDPADSSPGAIVEGGVALATTTAQGLVMAGAIDNQTQRAYQVVFEENDDGRRRARIQTYTLADDGDGGVTIIPEDVYLDSDGQLMSQTVSYGSPYGVTGGSLTGTDDVADFAFSGNPPMVYEVPRPTFP